MLTSDKHCGILIIVVERRNSLKKGQEFNSLKQLKIREQEIREKIIELDEKRVCLLNDLKIITEARMELEEYIRERGE